jgi:hypothetical protein
MIVLMAYQGIFPATRKKTEKFSALANKSVLCPVRRGCYAQGKTKHAAAGAFCGPHLGSTLRPMPDVTPAPAFESLKKMFPGLTEAEYASLDAWYAGYAALILRMYERITSDPAAYADFLALTDRPSRPSMTAKVDSLKQTGNS